MNETRLIRTEDTRAALYGGNLNAALGEQAMTRKQLAVELERIGFRVSEQAIGAWLRGEYAPSTTHQAAVAKVLRIPAHLLFPVTLEVAA